MRTLIAALHLWSVSALPICSESDAICLKLHIADQLLQISDLTQQLASTKGQLDLAKFAEQAAINAATASNTYAQHIVSETKSHWYESPVLWIATGFFIASALAIGIAAAFSHVTR